MFLLIALTGIYHGAVLAGTVKRFREKTFPTFVQALNDGASGYFGFLKAVGAAVARILWKPLAALFGGLSIRGAVRQTMFYSLGFFAGVVFLFSGPLKRPYVPKWNMWSSMAKAINANMFLPDSFSPSS